MSAKKFGVHAPAHDSFGALAVHLSVSFSRCDIKYKDLPHNCHIFTERVLTQHFCGDSPLKFMNTGVTYRVVPCRTVPPGDLNATNYNI